MNNSRYKIITGIDIGSYHIKVTIVKYAQKEKTKPQLLGTGYAESRGVRNGYILNMHEVAKSIKQALQQAEKNANVKVRSAFVSIGSIGIEEYESTGEVIPIRADSEITQTDMEKVIQDSEDRIIDSIPNRKIIHSIPLRFRVDNELVLGKPQSMKGSKLEVDSLFITAHEQHITEITNAIESIDIVVEDIMASPIASSFVLLNKAQKRAGCVLINIGAETVSIIVFEDFLPISIKIFPIGSSDITNDLALGLRIPIDEAEKAKRGGMTNTPIPKKKVEEIITARLVDIFELVDNHLKKIKKDGLLPAGAILTGGGSNLLGITSVASEILKLPAKNSTMEIGKSTKLKDSSWSVSYGLCLLGASDTEEKTAIGVTNPPAKSIWDWFRQFLP